jgi:cytochrome oxidase Cu insertion factor (SCO1/SenC/PrrC family)
MRTSPGINRAFDAIRKLAFVALYLVRKIVSIGLDSGASGARNPGWMRSLLLSLALLLLPAGVGAGMLKEGDHAPDFTLADQAGKPVRLADFRGKSNVVIAFYVMAFTPG